MRYGNASTLSTREERRLCDGLTRRDLLHIGGLSMLGLSLSDAQAARPVRSPGAAPGFGKAKACILLFPYGSPPQHETFDPKPDAPVEVRGERVSVVGVDPQTYRARRARPHRLADAGAAFRLLLCHFPGIVDTLPAASFGLVLARDLHAGQICLPRRGGRITLAHPRARFVAGLYETDAAVMHVSPGTGTTFVPFRLFARPEVTELVLRRRSC